MLPGTLEFRLELRDKFHICRANREDFVANKAFDAGPALPTGPIISAEVVESHSVFFSYVVFDLVGLDEAPDAVIVYELDQGQVVAVLLLTPEITLSVSVQ